MQRQRQSKLGSNSTSKSKGWNNSVKIDIKPERNVKLGLEGISRDKPSPITRSKKGYSENVVEKSLQKANRPMKLMKHSSETGTNTMGSKVVSDAISNNNGSGANFDTLVSLASINEVVANPYADLHKKIVKSIKPHRYREVSKTKKLAGGDEPNYDIAPQVIEMPMPCQLSTKLLTNELQGKRNTALLRIWTDSGPFSRVDAMTLASTVLDSKLTNDFLISGMTNEKQESFSTFVNDLNKLLSISGNTFDSIGQLHYLYIWHLYGIYTSSMLNEKCVETIFFREEDSLLDSASQSECEISIEDQKISNNVANNNISRNCRVPTDVDGVYEYFNLITDKATQMLTSINPALSECLADPLQSFLVVYWRFVELGNSSSCKYLSLNPLNQYIKVLQKQYSSPKATNKYITVKSNMTDDLNSYLSSLSTFPSSVFPDLKSLKTFHKPKNLKWSGDKFEKVNIDQITVCSKNKEYNKTICLDGCRYDVVRRIALESGFREVTENDVWNIIWTDVPLSLDRGLEMRRLQDANYVFANSQPPLQKANHFPGMNEICRKDRLARNLNRMKNIFGHEYDLFPRTWCLPADLPALMAYARSLNKPATYICKPDSGAQGKGIFLVRNLKKLNPFVRLICQLYIPRPLLIDGYKFDLRIYTLITCCDPLRVYIYKEGLARFATVKYIPPDDENIGVSFMHLTNYSLNKFSQSYNPDGEGSKRKMSNVFNYLLDEGYDVQSLVDSIDSVVIKTMIAAQPTLRQYYRASFPKAERPSSCFEILGFDILIDSNLQASILEVNHSPSFNLDLAVDAEVKEALLRDTFAIINLGYDSINKSLAPKRFEPSMILGQRLSRAVKAQFEYETYHQGNYRLIYPKENFAKYTKFFEQTKAPLNSDSPSDVFAKKKAELTLMSAAALSAIQQLQRKDDDYDTNIPTVNSTMKKMANSPYSSRAPFSRTGAVAYYSASFTRDGVKSISSRYTLKPRTPVTTNGSL